MNDLYNSFDFISHYHLETPEIEFGLTRQGGKQTLVFSSPAGWAGLAEFEGEITGQGERSLLVGQITAHNATALRHTVPWLKPQLLGLQRSAGLGDRLGLATPGHVRAVKAVGGVMPIYAQQSIREMNRSGRSAQQVMDDALWGMLAEDWRAGFGADADHLKTTEDIDVCVDAGFTFYTIDPGAYVDSQAEGEPAETLMEKARKMDWSLLESSPEDMLQRYGGKTFPFDRLKVTFDQEVLWRSLAKYGMAIVHVTRMFRYLQSKGISFELEVSVDETETPTTHAEHFWIANELKRLGVKWVSLAPRFVGRFEKGVEYQGDLDLLKADLDGHAEIARAMGPYKLSLHSGSDKFSVYPLLAEATRGMAHLKTAGTSYLEALRIIAFYDPVFFREILSIAGRHYDADRASYHVSASLDRLPDSRLISDEALPGLLDQFDARQVLHVTFGTILGQVREQLISTLEVQAEAYTVDLQQHFERHLRPFVGHE